MAEVVTLPKLGLSEIGELVAWEVAVGDHVEAGDVLAVIESDKASAEVEAPRSGVLLRTYVEEGTEIDIEPGRPIAAIGEEGETAPSPADLEDAGASATDVETAAGTESDGAAAGSGTDDDDVKVTPRARRYASEHGVDLAGIEGTGPQGAITEDDVRAAEEEHGDEGEADEDEDEDAGGDITATPRARRAAREYDVPLSAIEGTGPQGAVSEADVEAYVEEGAETAVDEDAEEAVESAVTEAATDEEAVESAVTEAGTDDGTTTDEGLTVTETRRLTGTRKTIAERLSQSAREKPHVMGTREISVERLDDVRARLEEELDADVTLNDLLLHFVGRTLEDLSQFNAHFVDGEHRLIEEVNVGYAVDGPRGLVVPVVEDVPERSLGDLASERRRQVQSVLDDEHTPADLQGGTFTVSNVGVYDMDVSYSIINPPQVAILAVGRRKPTAVERDGEVRFEECVTFSLTIDHRVLDGSDSGAFLERLAEYLEFPGRALDAV